MTPKTLLSFEDFAALPNDGTKHELNEGVLLTMPPPKHRHGTCQARVAAALLDFASSRDLGDVSTETGYRLTADTFRAPDVSFVSKARLQNPDEYFAGGPDLAVEIVSPGDDPTFAKKSSSIWTPEQPSSGWSIRAPAR